MDYAELVTIEAFEDRLASLVLWDVPHASPARAKAQAFYKSDIWLKTRHGIIMRDFTFDLGVFGKCIQSNIYVHHIDPITDEDLDRTSFKLIDPNNLICVSLETHNRIHYKQDFVPYVERESGDTKLW